jgi:hypothetical protein
MTAVDYSVRFPPVVIENIIYHLTLKECANFYRAFPDYDYWQCWFRWWFGKPKFESNHRILKLTMAFGKLTFPRFLKAAHPLVHGLQDELGSFHSKVYLYFRLQPTPLYVRAVACKFFPPRAPEPFANGFVLADDVKRVHFFALQEHEFRLVSIYEASRPVSGLLVSPRGTILLVNEGGHVTVIRLGRWTIKVAKTDLSNEASWWNSCEHFLDEDTFLLQQWVGALVVRVHVPYDIFVGEPQKTNFLPVSIPHPFFSTMPALFSYKALDGDIPDYFLFSVQSLHEHKTLVVIRNPFGYKRRFYVNVSRGYLGRWTLSSDRKHIYVVVLGRLSLEDFLAGRDAPRTMRASTALKKRAHSLVRMHVMVYLGTFGRATLTFVPRFYLGPRPPLPSGTLEWFARRPCQEVWSVTCHLTEHQLLVKVDSNRVANLSLFADPSTSPTYVTSQSDTFRIFAASSHGSYLLFFPSYFSHWCDVRAHRECPDFEDLYPDTKMFEIDCHAPVITPTFANPI